MKSNLVKILCVAAAVAAGVVVAVGCEKNSGEKAGAAMDKAAAKTVDAARTPPTKRRRRPKPQRRRPRMPPEK